MIHVTMCPGQIVVVEGIIGRRVLSDVSIPFLVIPMIGEHPYLFHVHVMKVTHVLYDII